MFSLWRKIIIDAAIIIMQRYRQSFTVRNAAGIAENVARIDASEIFLERIAVIINTTRTVTVIRQSTMAVIARPTATPFPPLK